MLKNLIFSLLCCSIFFVGSMDAQTSRMSNYPVGKTSSTENMYGTNLRYLLDAEEKVKTFNLQGALLSLDSAVEQYPGSAEAYVLRARLKAKLGMATEARQDVSKALTLNPYAVDLFGYNGSNGLRRVLALNPSSDLRPLDIDNRIADYLMNVSLINSPESGLEVKSALLGEVLYLIGEEDYKEANLVALELADSFPSSYLAMDLLGLSYLKLGNADAAIEALSKSVSLKPDFGIAWFNFAMAEKLKGNTEAYEKYLNRAIELNDNLTKAYFERAILLKSQGKPQEAIDDYTAIIEIRDNDGKALINRALTKKILGDYTGALADINRSIEARPDDADLYFNRGNIQSLFGRNLQAVDDFTKCIQLDPERGAAFYNRAVLHFKLYDYVSACSDLESAMILGYEPAGELMQFMCSD